MKRYVFFILVAIIAGLSIVLAIAMTKKSNNPPYVPDNPLPKSGSENVEGSVILSWGCSDPDGDELTYEVYLGTDPENLRLIAKDLKTNSYRITNLKSGTIYYWKVVATDSRGGKSESPVWTFKTAILNHPPKILSGFPTDGATNVSVDIVLSWRASDPDGDPITYDVYFGEGEPKLVVSGLSENTYSPGKLEYSKEYSWKIIARDPKGLKVEGPVWKFKTMEKPILPPSVPRAVYPKDGQTDVPLKVKLVWESSDPQNLPLKYDLYFGKSPNPKLRAKDLDKSEYTLERLDYGTTYYWKVVVRNSKGLENTGGIWRFKTEILKNHPPSVPDSPKPEDGAVGVSTSLILSWKCEDPDGDPVRYTLYLGSSPDSLEVVAPNLEKPEYNLKHLDYSTTYYWKVVAIDSKGARTQGKIWRFTTAEKPNTPPIFESVSVIELSEDHAVLSWKAKDPDGDVLVYDLYFGESKSPPLYRANLESEELKISNLKPGKEYSWYVVAKDPKGATTKSKVLTFKTKEVELPKPTVEKLLVGGGPEGMFLFDVSNPRKPRLVSKLDTPGIEAVSYTEFKFYDEDMRIALGGGRNGLVIAKVEGDSLKKLSFMDKLNVKDVQGVKRFALLSLWNEGFALLDIFTPANPNWIASVRLPGFSQSVYLSDVEVFSALRSEGVGVVSIERPFNPKFLGKFDVDGIAVDVVSDGKIAYVLSITNGLLIYDISDLKNPIRLSKIDLEGGYRIFYDGGKVYAVGEFGLAIIDVLDPRNPKIIATLKTKGTAKSVFVSKPYVYICADDLEVVWIDKLEKPVVVGRFDFGSSAEAAKVYSDKLFIVDRGYGIKIADVSDKAKPKFVSNIGIGEILSDVAVSGARLYALDSIGQLIEYDLRESKVISSIPIPGLPKRLVTIGNLGFIMSDLVEGFTIVDLEKMRFLRVIDLGFQPGALTVFGKRLIISGEKLVLVDPIDVESPKIVSSLKLPGESQTVAVFGNFVAVAGKNMPLEVYDFSDPVAPNLVGSVHVGNARSMVIKDSYLIVGTEDGMVIVDVSNPAKPKVVKKVVLPSPVKDMELFGNWLYVADSENGLVVYNVVDPWSPRLSIDFDWYNFYDVVGF